VRGRQTELDRKISLKDSFGKVKKAFTTMGGEMRYTSHMTGKVDDKVGSCQQQALELSSDASSDGGENPEFISEKNKWVEDVNTKLRGGYTEGIES